jgi:hypothetical protein
MKMQNNIELAVKAASSRLMTWTIKGILDFRDGEDSSRLLGFDAAV